LIIQNSYIYKIHLNLNLVKHILIYILLFNFIVLNAQKPVKTLQGHEKSVINISFSTDGELLSSIGADKTIRIWNLNDGQCLRVIRENENGDISSSFSLDDKFLTTGGWDGNIRIWNLNNGNLIKTINAHTSEIRKVISHPNGRMIASCSCDKKIKIWYKEDGKQFKQLSQHSECVRDIDLSKDGSKLASVSSDRNLIIWNTKDWSVIYKIDAHTLPIEAVCFSPDGNNVATAGMDNTIKIWNVNSGSLKLKINAHKETIYSISYSPDGKYIASGSIDKTVKIWDANSGQLIKTFKGHVYAVKKVVFSPNGKYLASSSDDAKINIWDTKFLNISPLYEPKINEKRDIFYVKPEIEKDSRKVIQKDKNLIEWLNPIKSDITVYEKNFELTAKIKDTLLSKYFLYINGELYKKTTPIIKKQKGSIDVKYNILLPDSCNIKLLAVNSDSTEIALTDDLKISCFDLSNSNKSKTLYVFVINVNLFVDNKLNENLSIYNSEKLVSLLKGQKGKLFKDVKVINLEGGSNSTKGNIFNTIKTTRNNIKSNDEVWIIMSSYIAESFGYYFLSSNTSKKNIVKDAIHMDNFYNILQDMPCKVISFIDLSREYSDYPEEVSNVDYREFCANWVYYYYIKNNGSFAIATKTNVFESLISALKYTNDINENGVISISELLRGISFTQRVNLDKKFLEYPFFKL